MPESCDSARTLEYVLGNLSEDDEARLLLHSDSCASCRSELKAFEAALLRMAKDLAPVSPPARLKRRLFERIGGSADESIPACKPPCSPQASDPRPWRNWTSTAVPSGQSPGNGRPEANGVSHGSEPLLVPSSDAWEPTGTAGVEVRRLFVDRESDRMTALFRMAPGSTYTAHVHAGVEECFVLEGDLRVGAKVMHRGDYQMAPAGSTHGPQSTENGCLLLISSSLSDELLQ